LWIRSKSYKTTEVEETNTLDMNQGKIGNSIEVMENMK